MVYRMFEWAVPLMLSLQQGFAALHFLRPHWLAGVGLAGVIYGVLWYRHDSSRQWRNFVAPHLLAHLVVRPPHRAYPGPRAWLCATLMLASLAMAGPTWNRQPAPFVSDVAPLVIVLHLGRSMDATDVQPSRLLRAEQKLRDLLQLRRGARTALIVFSTSAHRVLPLTDDVSLLSSYIATLRTDLVPVKLGGAPATAEALNLATELLSDDRTPGSVVLLTDNVGSLPEQLGLPNSLILWTFGAATAPVSWANHPKSTWVQATTDESDVRQVNFWITSQLASALTDSDAGPWQDDGALLLWPLLVLVAIGFRRGWVVRWQ
jgi:Ca-activated chloride channel family protein